MSEAGWWNSGLVRSPRPRRFDSMPFSSAVVHGTHVGQGSLIGMGAVLLGRTRIGRECLVAAGAVVVTTEKDVVKMDPEIFISGSVPLLYLPIEIEFLKNGKDFDEMVLNAVRSYAR